jgi:hypothetical protein
MHIAQTGLIASGTQKDEQESFLKERMVYSA